MQRVSVVGVSGAGKSTIAAELARRMGVPHLELDSVYHQADWTPLEREAFRARVADVVGLDGWVVDGNYSTVQDLVWDRADTVVWVDPPRRRAMRQIVLRTLRRLAFRVELWNGNQERWTNLFSRDPEQSVIAWAWTRYGDYRDRYAAAMQDPAYEHLRFVRVRSRSDVAALYGAADQAMTRSAPA